MDNEDDSQSLNSDGAGESEAVFHPAPELGTNSWTQQKSSLFPDVRGDAEGHLFQSSVQGFLLLAGWTTFYQTTLFDTNYNKWVKSKINKPAGHDAQAEKKASFEFWQPHQEQVKNGNLKLRQLGLESPLY